MEDFLKKIDSYNLFNYLLPGALYVAFFSAFADLSFLTQNVLISFFAMYFIGLTVSRIGSLLIEPLMMRFNLGEKGEYLDYIKASEEDATLTRLSEVSNVYRTLIALFICILLTAACAWLFQAIGLPITAVTVILGTALFALFVAAYRKQSSYVAKRVNDKRSDD